MISTSLAIFISSATFVHFLLPLELFLNEIQHKKNDIETKKKVQSPSKDGTHGITATECETTKAVPEWMCMAEIKP
jgi:hypothetical protein